ncbi:MAG: peptidoglycan-binding protein [Proteobacteria bacterium]|nr:MAG: peptidoglycan-binding protein [Pseudomonadota bacterium]
MRERRQKTRGGIAAGVIGGAAAIGFRLGARIARRPLDSLAMLGAGAACLVIVVNAVFLQKGSHPAPFFANPIRPPQAADTAATAATHAATTPALAPPRAAEATAAVRPPAAPRPQAPAARRNDPIAELIGASIGSPARVLAVQRALSEFGYGQIKISGTLDQATSAAIEKFEGEHRLPVTGRISDLLVSELAAMAGHPLQ